MICYWDYYPDRNAKMVVWEDPSVIPSGRPKFYGRITVSGMREVEHGFRGEVFRQVNAMFLPDFAARMMVAFDECGGANNHEHRGSGEHNHDNT